MMDRSRISALFLCLLAGGCLFSETAPDPTPDAATTSDVAVVDARVADTGGGSFNVISPDVRPSPDVGPPPPDLSGPDAGPPPTRDCSQVADPHPALYPVPVIVSGEVVTGDLSFTAYRRPQNQTGVALAILTNNGPRLHTYEINATTVSELASVSPSADFGAVRDIAVGRRVGGLFDIAVSGEDCLTSSYLWLFQGGDAMNPLVISGPCPSPIWGIAYAGGQRPFNGEVNGAHRAVYFEDSPAMLETRLVSLRAPYEASDYRSTSVLNNVNEGWVDGSAGDVVLFANGNDNLFAWDTGVEASLPVELGFSGRRRTTGFAALDEDRYVIARALGDNRVDVSIYRISSDSVQHVETVAMIEDVVPGAVDVASFPGGFATFIEDGGRSWTVQTYSAAGVPAEAVCDPYVHDMFNIDTEDVELVAYREGSALQVAAAVLFRMGGDGNQFINIEGPRWPNYFP